MAKETKDEAVEADIRRDAAAQERRRIADITAALADDRFADVRNRAVEQGLDVEQAKALGFAKAVELLQSETKRLQSEIDERDKKLKAIAEGGVDIAAAESVDTDTKTATAADGRPETYSSAVAELKKAGSKPGEAYKEAARKFPKSHKAWKEGRPKRSRE